MKVYKSIYIIFLYLFFVLFVAFSGKVNLYEISKKQEFVKAKHGDSQNYIDLVYSYQGVENNFRIYIDDSGKEQELIIWNLDESWENNRIKVNKRVKDFWAYTNSWGLFLIYKRSGNIYWKMYYINDGKEISGGFLNSEDVLKSSLKDVYFSSWKKGVFVSLVFYDNLSKQSYQVYYLDIWGNHDLVVEK